MNKRITNSATFTTLLAMGTALTAVNAGQNNGLEHVQTAVGQIIFEQTGQGINYPTAGLGAQFGYFSYVKGIQDVFTTTPENESTAVFTFYQDLANVRVTNNGPIRTVSREGTTTVYLNPAAGANFSNPDSFRSGVPVQTSIVRQQVVIDTITGVFTATNEDVITETASFSLNGSSYELGKPGDVLRTSRTGRANSPGLSPIGWFSGSTVGAEKAGKAD